MTRVTCCTTAGEPGRMSPSFQNKLFLIVAPPPASSPLATYEAQVESRLKQLMLPRCGRGKGLLDDETSNQPELMKKFPEKFLSNSQSSV